jgi:lipopolysaccharide biosynthesis glycosyltransferase
MLWTLSNSVTEGLSKMSVSKKLSKQSGEHLANKLNENDEVLVLGNGPSLKKFIPQTKSPHIFGANWIIESEEVRQHVEVYFASKNERKMFDRLNLKLRDGLLPKLNTIFTPFPINTFSGDIKLFDHWSIIAHNAALARFMMTRPLPTQGVQMIACAAISGARSIETLGIDLYSSNTERYAFEYPEVVKTSLMKKDLEAGYENNHELDVDLIFMLETLNNFDFEFDYLENSEIPEPIREQLKALRQSRKTPRNIHSLLKAKNKQKIMWEKNKDISSDGPKVKNTNAFITQISGDYFIGAMHLACQLRKLKSPYPLVILCSDQISFAHCSQLSRRLDVNVIIKQIEQVNNNYEVSQKRFMRTLDKLRVFSETNWKKLIYVDSDMLLLKNIDHLFSRREEFLAAPDWGNELTDGWNSGLFVFKPDKKMFDDMISKLENVTSWDGGDQGFLNNYFPAPTMLPYTYNCLIRIRNSFPVMFDKEELFCIHYVGANKPWHFNKNIDSIEWTTAAEAELLKFWIEYSRVVNAEKNKPAFMPKWILAAFQTRKTKIKTNAPWLFYFLKRHRRFLNL